GAGSLLPALFGLLNRICCCHKITRSQQKHLCGCRPDATHYRIRRFLKRRSLRPQLVAPTPATSDADADTRPPTVAVITWPVGVAVIRVGWVGIAIRRVPVAIAVISAAIGSAILSAPIGNFFSGCVRLR